MAGYAFRTFDERKKIEDLWEAGTPAKDIATKLNIDVRSCDLGIVNRLPRPLGAFSIFTPDGEYDD